MKIVHLRLPGRIVVAAFAAGTLYACIAGAGWMGGSCESSSVIVNPFVSETKAPGQPLRVAIYRGGGFAPGIVENGGLKASRDSEYFRKFGLLVEFMPVESHAECREMLCGGEADVIWADTALMARSYDNMKRVSPVAFMHYAWSRGEDLVVFPGGIAFHPGRTAACAANGKAHMMMRYILEKNGVNPDLVRWKLYNTDSEAVRCQINSPADMIGFSTPVVASRYIRDYPQASVISTRDAPYLLPGVFVAGEEFVINNREELKKFAAGWFEGQAKAAEKPDEAAALLASAFGMEVEAARSLLDRVKAADFNDNCMIFEIDGNVPVGFADCYETAERVWAGIRGRGYSGSAVFAKTTAVISCLIDENKKRKPGNWQNGFSYQTQLPESFQKLSADINIEFTSDSYEITPSMKTSMRNLASQAAFFTPMPIVLQPWTVTPGESIAMYKWQSRIKRVVGFFEELGFTAKRCVARSLVQKSPAPGGGKPDGVTLTIARPAESPAR